jgi:hypothetical protein
MTAVYDLCLAWNWEHDQGFVRLLEAAFLAKGRTLLQITPDSLDRSLAELASGAISFCAYLDRASEEDPRFLPLVEQVRARGVRSVNEYDLARRSWDKAAMHEVLFANVRTPYTIVLPSFREQPALGPVDLAPLGECFSIKPAHGGGGDGVIIEARSPEEVTVARQQFPADKYLLQTRVRPILAGQRPAWFRVLYCAGEIYPCWWDMQTHVYAPVTAAEESRYGLLPLRAIMETIAAVCRLGLFSTEIALTAEAGLVVVDYANDPIDLRLQSQTPEGVPDDIARFAAERLADLVGRDA